MAAAPRTLVSSPTGHARIATALAWLREKPRDAPLLVVASTIDAANQLLRQATAERGAVFGWHRESIGTLVGKLAALPLAQFGLAPVGALGLEAIAARVVFAQRERGELGRFGKIADRPGLARALARTIGELAMAGVEPADAGLEPDLARLYARYREALTQLGFADRARVHDEATRAIAVDAHPLLGIPVLLLDVRVNALREASFLAALVARASECLATTPTLDPRSLRYLQTALGVAATTAATGSDSTAPANTLRRLQAQLFEVPSETAELDDDVTILSAPGEAREAVEVARRLLQEAGRGVRFDRMAVLLRAPELYRAHFVEALRRARIPAYFARGALRPEPAGRALLALLACAAEGLSAQRFAEYLSLGVVPRPSTSGEPPAPRARAESWVAPDDDIVQLGQQLAFDALEDRTSDPDSPSETAPAQSSAEAPAVPTPRRWERLLVDAAVLGGRARWQRRLRGLEQELLLELRTDPTSDEPRAAAIARDLDALRALSAFALPLIADLDALPRRATWGEWITALAALATRAIADPTLVLQGLSELAPMQNVGPVQLAEVRLVLERRLGDALVRYASVLEGRVFVGTIEEARGMVFDVVCVPGLAEKIFPPRIAEDPLLLDTARKRVSPELLLAEDRLAAERCALQLAVGAASSRLVVSYPRFASDKARPRVPSFYGLEVLRAASGHLPGFDQLVRRARDSTQSRMGWPAPFESADAIDAAEYDLVVLQRFLSDAGSEWHGAAHYLLSVNPHLGRALRFRARRWHAKWFSADGLVQPSAAASQALAAHGLATRVYAPTLLEKYASCPYKFYLSAIAGLSPRARIAALEVLDPQKRGVLIHEVLRSFLTQLRDQGVLPLARANLDTARHTLDTTLAEIAARHHEELAPAIERVWQDGIAEIGADLREWLLRALDEDEPAWVPAYFELAFGLRRADSDQASRGEPVTLACGLRLRGSIDLVEARGAELRAVDYKTGVPEPNAGVVGGGKRLQPLLYALALQDLFPASSTVEGQAYYCTTRGGFARHEVPLDARAQMAATIVATTIGDALAQGFFPAAPDRGVCEHCEFIPVCGPYEEQRVARKDSRRLEPLVSLRRQP